MHIRKTTRSLTSKLSSQMSHNEREKTFLPDGLDKDLVAEKYALGGLVGMQLEVQISLRKLKCQFAECKRGG